MPLPVLQDGNQAGVPVGRLASYSLRVSVLESCSYHCPYCLPGAVTLPTARSHWLTPGHHARLAPLFHARGIHRVRFTGGEPLLRPDLLEVVQAWKAALGKDADLALTTNGQRLGQHLLELKSAGIRRVTIHLDTLREDRYPSLMGSSSPAHILQAASNARELFHEVKFNMVVQRGHNDDELEDFLALSRRMGIQVRFIELMNTGSATGYTQQAFFPGAEVVSRLAAQPMERAHPSAPAALFRSPTGVVFGVVASDTQPFCSACDRMRLTADGRVRGCLYQSGGVPLGPALREGASDAVLQGLVDAALDDKRSFHPLAAPHRAPFSMADIGG